MARITERDYMAHCVQDMVCFTNKQRRELQKCKLYYEGSKYPEMLTATCTSREAANCIPEFTDYASSVLQNTQ